MEELSYAKAYSSLRTLKERGFGGVVMFNKPPHGFTSEEYLSDNWFIMIENFVKAGIELDLEIWINDGFDYPPGSAAGRITKIDPSLKQYRIKKIDDKIVPVTVDWGFPAFEHPRSSQLFIELVYEEYNKRLGKYFGNGIRGFFSDADNRRINSKALRKDSDMRDYFPWSENFRETFEAQYGYDIWPFIEEVLNRKDSEHCVHYWQHCSDLYTQWFYNNYQWCKDHNLEYTFHSSDTSPFGIQTAQRSSVFSEGKFSDMERNCDYCGTDQELLELNGGKHYIAELLYTPCVSWGNCAGNRKSSDYYNVYGDVRTKQAQSTAFSYDKKGTMCEMFAASNMGASYEELREIAAFQILQGVTFIVPHAYQYRALGQTKYFAPPDFSEKGYMAYCREFNDELNRTISYSTKGTLSAQIAVLDITEELWKSKDHSELFLKVCQELNRMPHGYVIADKNCIEKKKEHFSMIINTTDEHLDFLFDIPVVNIKNIEELFSTVSSLPSAISYSGDGCPHFMVRETSEGACALIANIENEHEITGTVTFSNNNYAISLYPGETAFFSPKEQIYRRPVKILDTKLVEPYCRVKWSDANVLPIARWLDKNGKACLQHEDEEVLYFDFNVLSEIHNLKLYIPVSCEKHISKLTGVDISSKKAAMNMDDPYHCYDVPVRLGQNTISIVKKSALNYYDIIYLCGEFDVTIDSANPFFKENFRIYNLKSYIPEDATISLSARRNILDANQSAALQGHPFYKGSVTYYTEFDIPSDGGNYQLTIGNACNGVTVTLNNSKQQNILFRPYSILLTQTGTVKAELTTHATMAKFYEMYPRDFGIIGGIRIERIQ